MVSTMFYMEVLKSVLLFGLDSWSLSEAMTMPVDGTHI